MNTKPLPPTLNVLEDIFKDLLQSNLRFKCRSKPFKEGRLLLYKINTFCIDLQMTNKRARLPKEEDIYIYNIPIPFNIYKDDDNRIFLDYQLKTVVNNEPDLLKQITAVTPRRKIKFYNALVELERDV